MLKVGIYDYHQALFDGVANRVILPGDYGVFEVLIYHKPLLSLLRKGEIIVDDVGFPISRGIVRVRDNELVALVEL